MKILYISHHLKGNDGWSRYARDLIAETQKNGAGVLCLVNELDPETNIAQKALLKKEPLAYIINPIISFFDAQKVNSVIDEFQPDIIHFIVEPYATMVPFIKKGKAKIVITAHSTFAYLPILLTGFKRKFAEQVTLSYYKKVDSVISVSKYTEDHLKKHMGAIGGLKYLEGKLNIVSGGVASESIDDSPRKPLSNSPREILFVGALKPRKGVIEALEVLSQVKTDFVYRIVGSHDPKNPYVGLIREKIKSLGLEGKVVLTGSISDSELKSLYEKADLFLMLSMNNGADFEGFGLVYIEANGRGVPVIGSRDSGVADAILSGKTGYLVDQHDVVGVAGLIDDVLQKNTIKAEDCLAWARENRSDVKAKKVFEIYSNLLK